jgi:hypothetical protein
VVPVQSVYVHVYVFVPEHAGLAPTTGPVMVNVVPHELTTVGGVGVTALAMHATVEAVFAGIVNVGGEIVYVYVHCAELPVAGSV